MTPTDTIRDHLEDLELTWVQPTDSFGADPRTRYASITHIGANSSQATLNSDQPRTFQDNGTVQVTLYAPVNQSPWEPVDEIQTRLMRDIRVGDLVIDSVVVSPSTPNRGRTATPININWSRIA